MEEYKCECGRVFKSATSRNSHYRFCSVHIPIKKYDENQGKSLCRFLELIIDRRIIRLLQNDTKTVSTVTLNEEVTNPKYNDNVLDKMVYESQLKELIEVELDELKKDILHKVLIEGMTIKEYSHKYNIAIKDVYNHIYLLRLNYLFSSTFH